MNGDAVTVFDLEANRLYNPTVIHCITVGGPESPSESFSTDPVGLGTSTIERGLERLREPQKGTLVGHNIIGFDLPVLKTLHNWEPHENTKIFDTLVVSRLLNPDRRKHSSDTSKSGPHSLEAWGYRVGKAKPHHETWDVLDPAMLRRNREDVEINNLVYTLLQGEMKGHNWDKAIELEQEIARIITEQEKTGVYFDTEQAELFVEQLEERIDAIDAELSPNLPVSFQPHGASVRKPFKVDGTYSKMVTDWFPQLEGNTGNLVGGPFTRLKWVEMNLGSMPQVKDYLLKNGWVPTQWNFKDGEKTSPKLTEDSFDTIKGDFGQKIKERVLTRHRKSQIEGWLKAVRLDHRIGAAANSLGTPTGRMRHSVVANVPKAHPSVFFGKEMRSLFQATPGRVFVGYDAEQLELRILAHYMDDPDYIKEILDGDIHTLNQTKAGLPTRDNAKTFIYAFIYGAGDGKLGLVVGGDELSGASLRREFLSATPKLERLIRNVKRAAKKGWLKGLDGRKLFMRRNEEGEVMAHKALNTLIQGGGAIVMKVSTVILDKLVKESGVDAWKVVDYHDESIFDCNPKDVEKLKELIQKAAVLTTEQLNLRIPIAFGTKVGYNWGEVH